MKLVVVDQRGGLLPFASLAARQGFEDVAGYVHNPLDTGLHEGLFPTRLRSPLALGKHLEECDPAGTVVVVSGAVQVADSARDRGLYEAAGGRDVETPASLFGTFAALLRERGFRVFGGARFSDAFEADFGAFKAWAQHRCRRRAVRPERGGVLVREEGWWDGRALRLRTAWTYAHTAQPWQSFMVGGSASGGLAPWDRVLELVTAEEPYEGPISVLLTPDGHLVRVLFRPQVPGLYALLGLLRAPIPRLLTWSAGIEDDELLALGSLRPLPEGTAVHELGPRIVPFDVKEEPDGVRSTGKQELFGWAAGMDSDPDPCLWQLRNGLLRAKVDAPLELDLPGEVLTEVLQTWKQNRRSWGR